MHATHAVGIDLGTTYSCIAYLNEHGEPVTLANQEGELSTPSVVLFDGDEAVVGTEALRNVIVHPGRVVQNSKRYIGNASHRWMINERPYTPIDIATFILKKLISAAQDQIGSIEQAVITVPAQFSDAQRHATVEAGHRAGLAKVDIINEPVAAALCYVLGTEGLWFSELADAQRVMVYDLGGGTFDLSLVSYKKNEVSVIASSGDLNLGGIDWNHSLEQAVCEQFVKEFGDNPQNDAASLQALALEVEQTKRSLSVRPRAALTCQHAGHRKTFQIELEQFEKLTKPQVDRTIDITKRLLKDSRMGWAHVDVLLTTGGASRMPMIRKRLKKISGRTRNTALSPDLSIARGATYYAGMLLTNSKFARSILNKEASSRLSQVRQRSVNARALGILIRDVETDKRVPHYLVPANTPLPAQTTQKFGTVVTNQRRVHLQIVESGTSPDLPPVKLGACVIEDLPPNLPEGSEIAVTISYDAEARVHVSAKDVASGKQASAEIIRQENLKPQLTSDQGDDAAMIPPSARPKTPSRQERSRKKPPAGSIPSPAPAPSSSIGGLEADNLADARREDVALEQASQPVPLCNACGGPLDSHGGCPACGTTAQTRTQTAARSKGSLPEKSTRPPKKEQTGPAARRPAPRPVPPPRPAGIPALPIDDEIIELDESPFAKPPAAKRQTKPAKPVAKKSTPPKGRRAKAKAAKKRSHRDPNEAEEQEFWRIVDD